MTREWLKVQVRQIGWSSRRTRKIGRGVYGHTVSPILPKSNEEIRRFGGRKVSKFEEIRRVGEIFVTET